METSPGAEAAPPSTDDVGAGRTRARSPGSSSAEAIGGARGSSRRHHGTEAPENGAAAIGSGGRRGWGTPGAPVGRRPRAQSVRPAGARAKLAGLGDRLAGRRRAGRAGSRSPARSRPTAVSRARGRGFELGLTLRFHAGGLTSVRAGPTAREERRFHARNARRSTARRPSTTRASPPRPAIRAPRDDVFTSSRGGHRPHRAPGICTGTARPRRSSFLFIKTTNPGCQVWSERGTKHKHASTAFLPQVPSRSRRERSARHRPFGPPVQSAHIESGTARRPGLRLLRARLARQRRRRDRDDPIDGLTTRR